MIKFNTNIRQKVVPDLVESLANFEEITELLHHKSEKTLMWSPINKDSHHLYDHYLDAILTVYFNKYYLLCKSLIQSLNEENYLLYGLIGRSLIEHTAILRYYVTSKMFPLVKIALEDGKVTTEEVETIIPWLEKHIIGNRFDWGDFLVDYFDELDNLKPGNILKNSQVNVLTCLQKWMQEDQSIHDLYSLFCDLVHPNLGSTLLISNVVNNQICIGGHSGEAIALEIVNRTFKQLLSIFREVSEQLKQLQNFKFADYIRVS
ncbi:hypothetical protein [Cyanothece sp. BG0011]|uniref:hypothetical protein n=1 Tax=Cyanothece sp. BG0011 TaxID=2082950 RepID=UPI000D1F4C05|nr:hypothetical protein [Cyanothece sp. BG0011]